jgi:hypothetical protein
MEHRRTHATTQGFTLLELGIAMGISVVILGFIGLMENQLSRVATFINQELQNQQGLSLVFDTFVTEVRSMGPSSIGSYPIEAVSSTSITFFSDIDEDGTFERVRYSITSSTFEKAVIEPTGSPLQYATSSETSRVLITNVLAASSSFSYFDSTYTGEESPLGFPVNIPAVRVVRVDIYADISPSTAPQPSFFTNTITIRNLRSN